MYDALTKHIDKAFRLSAANISCYRPTLETACIEQYSLILKLRNYSL